MEYHNLEFIIDKSRDSDNLDHMIRKLFSCLLGLNDVEIKKNVNFFNNTVLLNFINRNDIIKLEDKEKKLFLKYLDMFHKNDYFVSCDRETVQFLLLIFDQKEISVLSDMFMYYRGNFLTEDKKIKIQSLDRILNKGVGYYEDEKEITNILNVKNLKKFKLGKNTNIYEILDGKIKTNYYLLNSQLDKENIERITKSKLPYFEYDNTSVQSKFYLINSMKQIGKKDNLPSYRLKNIVKTINSKNFFEAESYSVYLNYVSSLGLKNFQYERFKNLEDSIAYNIMLTQDDVHGVLIKQDMYYCVCYQNTEKIKKEFSIEESKKVIISDFTKEEIEKYNLNEKDLYYLVNIGKNNKGDILLPDTKNIFTDQGNLIPVDFLENKNLYHYNIFDDLLQKTKNKSSFDRNKIKIDIDIDIEFMEKIDFFYCLTVKNTDLNVLLERDIFIDGELKFMEQIIKNFWKKGYFLTDYGIYRYSVTGILKNSDVKFPSWFKSTDPDSYNWLVSTLKEMV